MKNLDAAPGVQYFKQTANIDLSGQSWTPFEFGGHFDGNGKTISHVTINMPGSDYVGFFSRLLYGGELKNVGLENVDVKAQYYVGGLVGYAIGSISNSYASGSVSGSSDVGGLVGYASGSISNSYASGSVSGTSGSYNVGGLVGNATFNSSISNSYASGSVDGFTNVGGLVGFAYTNSSISNSYASGSVAGSYNVGGLVGFADINSSITSSYYDSVTANIRYNGKGIPRTTTEMKEGSPSSTIYTGWEFAIWDFGTSSDYPTLKK